MSDTETPLDEIDESIEDSDIEVDEPSEDVDPDPVASLKAEVAALKSQLEKPAWVNDLKTIEGRIRSAEARLQKTEDPTARATLQRELEAKLAESNELIATMLAGLDDSAFIDPSVKQRAQSVLNETREKQREAALIERIRSESAPAPVQQPPESQTFTSEHLTFEALWEDRIRDEGFDPDGDDWKAIWPQVGTLFRTGATTADASNLMKSHLKELKDERAAARTRTQAKRSAGGGSPRGAGVAADILSDPNRSRDERADYLRRQGVQVGPI